MIALGGSLKIKILQLKNCPNSFDFIIKLFRNKVL